MSKQKDKKSDRLVTDHGGMGPLFPMQPVKERNDENLREAHAHAQTLLNSGEMTLLSFASAYSKEKNKEQSQLTDSEHKKITNLIRGTSDLLSKMKIDLDEIVKLKNEYIASSKEELDSENGIGIAYTLYFKLDEWTNTYLADVLPNILEMNDIGNKLLDIGNAAQEELDLMIKEKGNE